MDSSRLAPLGNCTIGAQIRVFTFVSSCLVLHECSHNFILDVDFKRECNTGIDLQSGHSTFSAKQTIDSEDDRWRPNRLCASDDSITLPA